MYPVGTLHETAWRARLCRQPGQPAPARCAEVVVLRLAGAAQDQDGARLRLDAGLGAERAGAAAAAQLGRIVAGGVEHADPGGAEGLRGQGELQRLMVPVEDDVEAV